MIGGISGIFDSVLGRGDAAITVPPLDGALRPNRRLDEAGRRLPLAGVDCLASVGGRLFASAGERVLALDPGAGQWVEHTRYPAAVACIAPVGEAGFAIALADGTISIEGGAFDGRRYEAGPKVRCITALAASDDALFVANGSADHPAEAWARNLMMRGSSGSIWRIGLDDGKATRMARGLAWPAGLALDGDGLVVSEAWRHRLIRLGVSRSTRLQVLHSDLPGYPGRLSSAGGGWWLAMFAPRSQLVEFVLRERGYCRKMLAEAPPHYWVAPKLRSGRSFYEPLQGGGVKQLGLLKPWAPMMSAGIAVRLDSDFQPRLSLQSRADGSTHGVTSVVEHLGQLTVAARGDEVVVSLPLSEIGDVQ